MDFVFQFFLKFRTFFKKISMNFFHFLWCDFANRKSTVYGMVLGLLIVSFLFVIYNQTGNGDTAFLYTLAYFCTGIWIIAPLTILFPILFFIESKNKKRIKSKIVENKYYKIFSVILFLPFLLYFIIALIILAFWLPYAINAIFIELRYLFF